MTKEQIEIRHQMTPGIPDFFGKRFERISHGLLKQTKRFNGFQEGIWVNYFEEKYFSGIDLNKFYPRGSSVWYQTWLNIYMRINERDFGVKEPFAKSIDFYHNIYHTRPPWAWSFTKKAITLNDKNKNMVSFKNLINPDKNCRWIERELVLDNLGHRALIERHLKGDGVIQAVGTISEQRDNSSDCLCRLEKRASRKSFELDSVWFVEQDDDEFEKMLLAPGPLFS